MGWVGRDSLVHYVLACGVVDNFSLVPFVDWADVPGCNHVFCGGIYGSRWFFLPGFAAVVIAAVPSEIRQQRN